MGHCLRVLFLQVPVQARKLVARPQKPHQALHHGQVLQVFVAQFEGGLPARLKAPPDLPEEGGIVADLRFEFGAFENDGAAFALALGIGQDPLVGGHCQLVGHVAFQRAARQDDLGAAGIGQRRRAHPRVVVMEHAKPGQTVRFLPHPRDKGHRVAFPVPQADPEELLLPLMGDEVGIEQLAPAFQVRQGVDIAFKEIGPGAHAREDDEVVERAGHDLAHQIGP